MFFEGRNNYVHKEGSKMGLNKMYVETAFSNEDICWRRKISDLQKVLFRHNYSVSVWSWSVYDDKIWPK